MFASAGSRTGICAVALLLAIPGPWCAAEKNAAVAPASDGTSVTLLGTRGGPGGAADRAGIATLFTTGGRHYLVAGRLSILGPPGTNRLAAAIVAYLGVAVAARNKSYAYRFEATDRTVVFTGDTGPSPVLARLASNADLLVAELVSAADIASVPDSVSRHMREEHLTAAAVGKLAHDARVATLVLSHIREVSDADVAGIRQRFSGRIVVGSDLDRY